MFPFLRTNCNKTGAILLNNRFPSTGWIVCD